MPLVKSTNGKYYRVENEQEVSEQEVVQEVARLQSELTSIEALVTPVHVEAAPVAPVEPVTPVVTETHVEGVEAVVAPELPAHSVDANAPDPNSVNLS